MKCFSVTKFDSLNFSTRFKRIENAPKQSIQQSVICKYSTIFQLQVVSIEFKNSFKTYYDSDGDIPCSLATHH